MMSITKKTNTIYLILYDVTLVLTLFTIVRRYSWFAFFQSSFIMALLSYVAILFSFAILGLAILKYKESDLFKLLLLLFIVVTVGFISRWIITLWLSFVIIVGAKNISFRHIVKVHFFSMALFCLSNMIAFEMGWIDDPNIKSSLRENVFGDVTITKRYGYMASTDYAIHVFFILLDYWIIRGGKFKIFEYLVFSGFVYFIYINCDARLASICILLIICFSPMVSYMKKSNSIFCMVLKRSFSFSIPIFAIISLYTTLAYDSMNFNWMVADLFFTGRLSLSQEALQRYGIPLFGQPIEFYGTGNSGVGAAAYDYVDSSYVQFYIVWGALLMTLLLYLFYIIGKKAYKRNDVIILFSLFISGLTGIITQFLFHLGYCVLLLALCSSHDTKNVRKLLCKHSYN